MNLTTMGGHAGGRRILMTVALNHSRGGEIRVKFVSGRRIEDIDRYRYFYRRRTAQKRVTEGRWRMIVLGGLLAEQDMG